LAPTAVPLLLNPDYTPPRPLSGVFGSHPKYAGAIEELYAAALTDAVHEPAAEEEALYRYAERVAGCFPLHRTPPVATRFGSLRYECPAGSPLQHLSVVRAPGSGETYSGKVSRCGLR
jgi:hypothetical protein